MKIFCQECEKPIWEDGSRIKGAILVRMPPRKSTPKPAAEMLVSHITGMCPECHPNNSWISMEGISEPVSDEEIEEYFATEMVVEDIMED